MLLKLDKKGFSAEAVEIGGKKLRDDLVYRVEGRTVTVEFAPEDIAGTRSFDYLVLVMLLASGRSVAISRFPAQDLGAYELTP